MFFHSVADPKKTIIVMQIALPIQSVLHPSSTRLSAGTHVLMTIEDLLVALRDLSFKHFEISNAKCLGQPKLCPYNS